MVGHYNSDKFEARTLYVVWLLICNEVSAIQIKSCRIISALIFKQALIFKPCLSISFLLVQLAKPMKPRHAAEDSKATVGSMRSTTGSVSL